jgi:DNA polymerase-1
LAVSILGKAEENTLFALEENPVKKETKAVAPVAESYKVADHDIKNTSHEYQLVQTDSEIKNLIALLEKTEMISFDTETTGIDANQAELVGISFSIEPNKAYYIPIDEDQKKAQIQVDQFKSILENPTKKFIGQNIKYDMLMMSWYGVQMPTPFFDTMIAHYLLEPDQRHKLDYLSEAYLNYKMVPIEDLIGKKGITQGSMRNVGLEEIKEYAGEDADVTLQLCSILSKDIENENLKDLINNIELPLVKVLKDIEFEGVRIDPDFLRNYSKVLEDQIRKSEKAIYEKCGTRFNIASPKQVGEVLFEKLKLPYRWKKTGSNQFSTDDEKLTELAKDFEVVNDIQEYRKLAKLKSTYVDSLPLMVNPKTGRVHSSFNQARAATGKPKSPKYSNKK